MWKSCESEEIGHSEPPQWEKFGNVANQAKLDIPSNSELLQWENFEKLQIR